MNLAEVIECEKQTIVPTYRRAPVLFTHGQGAILYDEQGRAYLDFAAGIAVMALGHSDPAWVAAVQAQAGQLVHVSNLFYTRPQVELARQLALLSFADRLFFSNSGAEANEAALKFARKAARRQSGHAGKHRILAFTQAFHGRTMGALSATYKAAYREPFAPLLPGVDFAPFNDEAAAEAAISADTCAVIVEPVQGEGGVNPATPAFLHTLRRLCHRHGALLIFDEVQCGLGRTGTLWAYEGYGVTPDIMTLAKPLAGGLPIGATLVSEAVAQALQPGDHGSTFAGGPLVCRAAQVVLQRVSQADFLAAVRRNGQRLLDGLRALNSGAVVAVRGMGLMAGVELEGEAKPVVERCRQNGLLLTTAGEKVLRLTPPLIVTAAQIDQAVATLAAALDGPF